MGAIGEFSYRQSAGDFPRKHTINFQFLNKIIENSVSVIYFTEKLTFFSRFLKKKYYILQIML